MGVTTMRVTVLVLVILLLLELFTGPTEGAKGGAKSVMNRRKKQRSRGGHGGGGAHESAGDGDGFGGEGDGARSLADRPCVGICHYQKMRGIVVSKDILMRMNKRKPCVGLCYINKKIKLDQLKRKKKEMMEKKEEHS